MNDFSKAQKTALVRLAFTDVGICALGCAHCMHNKGKARCAECDGHSEFVPNKAALKLAENYLSEINRIGNFYKERERNGKFDSPEVS